MQVNNLGISLQLIPESEKDRQTLQKLINSNDLDGWGCDELGKVLHAEIPLVPIGTIHHARPIDGLPPSGGNDARL